MNVLASIRPDSWNVPLFLHVLGAMVLVGSVATAGVAAVTANGSVEAAASLRRLAFRTLLIVALPAYFVMRIGAEWIRSKEFGDADEPTWIGIGYATSDIGLLLLLVAIILGWLGARRGAGGLTRAAGVIALVLTLAWLVTVWAMAGKP